MLSAFPKWELTKCLHHWEAGEGSDIPKETQLLLSSSLLKPCAAGFGWPKARVIDVWADRSGIFGKVKYLLLLWALYFSALQEATSANRQGVGCWIQNKPLAFLKAPVKLQFEKNNWAHNSLFGYDTELLEVRFLYHSTVSKEYQEEKELWNRVSFVFSKITLFCKWIWGNRTPWFKQNQRAKDNCNYTDIARAALLLKITSLYGADRLGQFCFFKSIPTFSLS